MRFLFALVLIACGASVADAGCRPIQRLRERVTIRERVTVRVVAPAPKMLTPFAATCSGCPAVLKK